MLQPPCSCPSMLAQNKLDIPALTRKNDVTRKYDEGALERETVCARAAGLVCMAARE